jgi:hypothetical protein
MADVLTRVLTGPRILSNITTPLTRSNPHALDSRIPNAAPTFICFILPAY